MRQLQRIGFSADIVGNGKLALEAYKQRPYDVILMGTQLNNTIIHSSCNFFA